VTLITLRLCAQRIISEAQRDEYRRRSRAGESPEKLMMELRALERRAAFTVVRDGA
jgi:hypothetical protein